MAKKPRKGGGADAGKKTARKASVKAANPLIDSVIGSPPAGPGGGIDLDPGIGGFEEAAGYNRFARAYNRFARAYNRFARAYNRFARAYNRFAR